jgi:6-phosphogluconolactonase (cycloisomerase 2 family)
MALTGSNGVTRRGFLGSGALLLAHTAFGIAKEPSPNSTKYATVAYVGTYTGAPGAGGNGEGIYCFTTNPSTGELTQPRLVAKTASPSWIVIHPSGKYLYAANEIGDDRGNNGSVSAFQIDRSTGDLTALNIANSEGSGPCYLSFDATGSFVFVANYGGGSIAVLPIREGGMLSSASDVHRDLGNLGATQATNAPAGSFALSGHDAPHAHMIAPDPQGRFILSTDLGQDRIYSYWFDRKLGKLSSASNAAFTALPSGDGPRHFAFHPNGNWLYVLQEEASKLTLFFYHPEDSSLEAQQTVSTLPVGFAGTSYASEILISPNGKYLYAANRLQDSIAAFSIGPQGRLEWIGEVSTMGDYPVQCRIDPSGKFLYACNRRSDSITSFALNRASGRLVFTGQYAAVGSPASIAFLQLGHG